MSMINDILKSAVNNVQREKDEFDVDKWAEEKNAERQWAYQTQDEMATKITEDSKLYQTYLDDQNKKKCKKQSITNLKRKIEKRKGASKL